MSRIAGKVYAIERHKELAELARARLKALGYDNIEIIRADGTKGVPEQAPFDAILVSAGGGPKVPETLKQQLAMGGRLVIPVGRDIHQTLLLVRRIDEDEFEQEDYGAVTFVPLIGAEGWVEPEQAKATKIDAETSRLPRRAARPVATRSGHPLQLLDQMVPGQKPKVPEKPKQDTGYQLYKFPERPDVGAMFF
jgi:hypothetical protein